MEARRSPWASFSDEDTPPGPTVQAPLPEITKLCLGPASVTRVGLSTAFRSLTDRGLHTPKCCWLLPACPPTAGALPRPLVIFPERVFHLDMRKEQ